MPPAPVDTRRLHDSVFSLITAREFLPALTILEGLLKLGDRSPAMQLAYAVCLVETGHGEQAAAVIDAVRQLLARADPALQSSLGPAVDQIAQRLPGGPLAAEASGAWDPVSTLFR